MLSNVGFEGELFEHGLTVSLVLGIDTVGLVMGVGVISHGY